MTLIGRLFLPGPNRFEQVFKGTVRKISRKSEDRRANEGGRQIYSVLLCHGSHGGEGASAGGDSPTAAILFCVGVTADKLAKTIANGHLIAPNAAYVWYYPNY
jgi:hypothetical protein